MEERACEKTASTAESVDKSGQRHPVPLRQMAHEQSGLTLVGYLTTFADVTRGTPL